MLWSLLCTAVAVADTAVGAKLHEHRDGFFSPDAVLRVKGQNITAGGIHKFAPVVNGSMPGPTLRIPENQVIWIRVYNDMHDENLTMHWHGLAQAAYPFSDGTPLASQWPIPPQHFFDYELKTEKGSAGSYFYHSHIGLQAMTACGALIVRDSGPPPYSVDGEKIVFLQELWKQPDEGMVEDLLATPTKWPGEPNTWLINGKASNDNSSHPTDPNDSNELAVFDVEPDQTYRFRFIAASALSLALLAFEDHNQLDIIQADGSYTKPYPVDLIQIGTGQRLEALLKTKNCAELETQHEEKLDFYMQLQTGGRTRNVTNYAVLRYKNTCGFQEVSRLSTTKNPSNQRDLPELPDTIEGYLDYKLEPLDESGEKFPTAAEVSRRVILNMQQIRKSYVVWTINNQSWSEETKKSLPHTVPEEPYLVSMYHNRTRYLPDYGAAVANGGLDPHTQTYPARIGEVVEVVLQQIGNIGLGPGSADRKKFKFDTKAQVHPWHAHGAHFWDAGGGPGGWDPEKVEKQLAGTRPVLRDTTIVYGYGQETEAGTKAGWRVWRMRITQPGVWMVHCHILAHMVSGMQTVWVHGDGKDLLKAPRPDVAGYLEYGGDAYGNVSHAPRVLHFHELDAPRRASPVDVDVDS
ncbi:hypothetical protein HIM_08887 [Hirsutella minnesotensis 3608]|uniref:L-ascorbate oxidase n=1 Tax=Hirsutella minnesotensis 3608 TaxID=1043627 RepID=A0A0F7ZM64_9HYPO|nr:hypothetical protein HIM_08887 [Hirsutella minnesotensis 3608]